MVKKFLVLGAACLVSSSSSTSSCSSGSVRLLRLGATTSHLPRAILKARVSTQKAARRSLLCWKLGNACATPKDMNALAAPLRTEGNALEQRPATNAVALASRMGGVLQSKSAALASAIPAPTRLVQNIAHTGFFSPRCFYRCRRLCGRPYRHVWFRLHRHGCRSLLQTHLRRTCGFRRSFERFGRRR